MAGFGTDFNRSLSDSSAYALEKGSASNNREGLFYPGLEAIDKVCSDLYPDQENPLQATALVKYWMGGTNPLDYISMYSNPGDTHNGISEHWHYITYGFSDLYHDGRVHSNSSGGDQLSGFGFELTFRLQKQANESDPPMWPASLLNNLAKYVFQTGNVLQLGDHIPWHNPLDSSLHSKIRHMLVTADPQLLDIKTPSGKLEFRQIVGVMDDEVRVAQQWKGTGMLQLMTFLPHIGELFITDMERRESVFELRPELLHIVSEGMENDGSNLGHVTAVCSWSPMGTDSECECLAAGATAGTMHIGQGEARESMVTKSQQGGQSLESVHLKLDKEAAELLPLIIRSRLQKGRFFVFHNASGQSIHLVPYKQLEMEGHFVSELDMLKADEKYLQIFCSDSLIEQMSVEFEPLQDMVKFQRSSIHEFNFSTPSIKISVLPRRKID